MINKLTLCIVTIIGISLLQADEGMWTFDNPPLKKLQEQYGFTPSQAWLDHVRLASVRFMDGGSGAFVSRQGLVVTNHHVAMGQLQKLSTAEQDWVTTGFYAHTQSKELKCPDLEVNVLMAMENVTSLIQGVVKPEMTEALALKARKAEISRIEQEYQAKTGLTCNVVNLYYGGEYWVYQYKKYTDVRLVMAPERQAAYFGGDNDNFTFPRHDLDIAFFRVYENDAPLSCEHYLQWNTAGAANNELIFVSGNPGSTNRLQTMSQLEYQRDTYYPLLLAYLQQRIAILHGYSQLGKEQKRRGLQQIFGLENSRKARTGEYAGLLELGLMEKCQRSETALRKLVSENPAWQTAYGAAWETIAQVMKLQRDKAKQQFYQTVRISRLASLAATIVRYVTEVKKPDVERLEGFHDSQLERLKFYLFSPSPIYLDLEVANLGGMLQLTVEQLGSSDPFLKIVVGNLDPRQVAKELVQGTNLADVKVRRELIEGGEEAVQQSLDTMIVLARALDPMLREREDESRKQIESVLTAAGEKIAKARFTVYGKTTYPDATFTLRLTYGLVKGYPMNGTQAPYKTTLHGLYDRSLGFDNQGDYFLPSRFWERRDKLDLTTAVNFVSACDIIGGNSGSPVINKKGELVGIIFDGNIESLPGRFIYDDSKNRAVAVHSAYVIEALRKLYDAADLADEIEKN